MTESAPKPRRRTCPRCGHKHVRDSFMTKSRLCRSCRRQYGLRARRDAFALLVNDAFGPHDDQLREAIGQQWVAKFARRLQEVTDAR